MSKSFSSFVTLSEYLRSVREQHDSDLLYEIQSTKDLCIGGISSLVFRLRMIENGRNSFNTAINIYTDTEEPQHVGKVEFQGGRRRRMYSSIRGVTHGDNDSE